MPPLPPVTTATFPLRSNQSMGTPLREPTGRRWCGSAAGARKSPRARRAGDDRASVPLPSAASASGSMRTRGTIRGTGNGFPTTPPVATKARRIPRAAVECRRRPRRDGAKRDVLLHAHGTDRRLCPSAARCQDREPCTGRRNKILERVFGYDAFRGEQEPIIGHVAGGGDALVVMPTGGGKSLCYQIPALLRDGVAVVVSPLIALIAGSGGRPAAGRSACRVSQLDAHLRRSPGSRDRCPRRDRSTCSTSRRNA